ncbi:MAG: DMT family transporter [Burkholderiaceae bacterium]
MSPVAAPKRNGATPHVGAPWLAYACLAGSMTLVGSYVGFSRSLVLVFPVLLLAWLRFGIAGIAMLGWLRRAPGEPALSAREHRLLFAESFFGNFLFSICMLYGMSMTSALAAGVIMAALPAVVALLSWGWLRERITPRVGAAIVCAVAGIALVSASRGGGTAAHGTLAGHLLLLAAVICEAIYVVVGKQLSDRIGPRRISALINLWGLALVTPFGVWQAWHFDFASVSGPAWLGLAAYSIAASVVTVWLWMTGLRHVPASSAGIYTVMLPVAAAAVGVLFLGERFSAAQSAAFGLALIGVVLATWPARSQAASTALR